ncbi:competence/damage-inducible protein A [Peptostreptococcus equinus]|uniref:Putative competence-damage inducible protein n=1 Tax=Peptostreptococcus equinus TaxID=3003601 RepID=A0ABY7JKX6_9FIRM|nr:competence/damage-inducible protein A [Peptostreptococcus sp. CBA3647]WAW14004.1 competence/damage-inducible protein A [Peptostreptococcus sp. CBA3647]
MNIELISVGTELLLGDIVNTNAQYISKELALLGINVHKQVTVGDNMDRLLDCFSKAFEKSDIVLTTGGLGPTGDDITKEAAAKFFDQKMLLDEKSWEKIKERVLKFTGDINKIPKNNIKQAMFPKEAMIIPNNNGTAPGAIFEKDGKRIIVMPGPPKEMMAMFNEGVLPYLKKETDSVFASKYIRLYGIGESALEIKLLDILDKQDNPTVALYAKEGEVLIRVTAKAPDKEECLKLVQEKIKEIEEICGEYIYLIGDESISSSQTELDNVVAKLLIENKKTIAVAESCTGGMIAANLINYPGISECLLEGCVTYSNNAKMNRLGVKKDTLDELGAVSSQTAIEMAIGIAKTSGADIGLSTTGVAGPDGGSEEKPVGLVYIGLYVDGQEFVYKNIFSGNRLKIRERATRQALDYVRQKLV